MGQRHSFAGAFLVLSCLTACGGAERKEEPVPAPAPRAQAWPEAVVAQFRADCVASAGGHAELCACMARTLQAQLSYARYQEVEQRLARGEPDPEFDRLQAEALRVCVRDSTEMREAFRRSFLQACMQSGGSREPVCQCVLEAIERHKPLPDLLELGQATADAPERKEFEAFIVEQSRLCAEQLGVAGH